MKRRVLLAVFCAFLTVQCSGTSTAVLGARDNQLAPCPSGSGCVSSQSEDPTQYMAPLEYEGTPEAARARLLQVLSVMEGASVAVDTSDYLRIEFTSKVLNLVDDVEFLFAPDGRTIHFRSAARKGYSDLGGNRRRMEMIRDAFAR